MQLNYIYNKSHEKVEVDIVFDEYTDICVVGLGTSGSLAAISASKGGAKVIGIEKLASMGGAGTNAGVYDYFYGSAGGEFEQINEQCFDMLGKGYLSSDRYENKNSIPGFIKAKILEDVALQYGCMLYYNTSVMGVFMQGNKVVGLQVFKDNHIINIAAKVVIDCTGEAFICRLCDCEFMGGRPWDNQLMRFAKAVGMLYNNYQLSIWYNYDFIDICDAKKYSQKVLEAMTIPVVLRDWYEEEDKVLFESSHIGLRECFSVVTEETYTFRDVIDGKQQKDSLFYAFAPLDNTNHDIGFESREHQDWFMFAGMSEYAFSVGVSKNMMIPKGMDGLMIAAKGIGIGHDLSGLLRMKKDMEKCGESAGVIAFLAVKNNISVRDVAYHEIIKYTSVSKCYDKENDIGFRNKAKLSDGSYSLADFPATIDEIKDCLSSYNCGTAFWVVYTMNKSDICPKLTQWMAEKKEPLSTNCAMALGMLGDDGGIEILRKIIQTIPKMPKVISQERYYLDFAKAITLIGRLQDEQSVDNLLDIMECDGRKYSVNLEVNGYYRTISQYECNFVSLAITALLNIAEISSRKEEITKKITAWALKPRSDIELEKIRKTVIAGFENRKECL